jgi:hypothetical protein
MIFKKDNLKLGLALGLLGPILGLVTIYFIKYSYWSFTEFLENVFQDNRLITSIGTLSLLANAVIFTLYVNANKHNTYKGIFIVTLMYGIGILLLKVFK